MKTHFPAFVMRFKATRKWPIVYCRLPQDIFNRIVEDILGRGGEGRVCNTRWLLLYGGELKQIKLLVILPMES